ncbi:MAG: glycosyltransferase [Frankiaceae bacterium]|nr:glycosyltransferase [Frankiaceae bacterium]
MTAPDDVVRLAEERDTARAAKDFVESDRLRDEIAARGWLVRDAADGWSLAEKPPYDVLPSVRDLPDRSGQPSTRPCTVALLVDGWPEDVRTCVQALLEHAPERLDLVVVLLENGTTDAGGVVHELARDPRVEELHVASPAGWGEARQALLAYDVADIHVLMDVSTVLEGDALEPLLAAFEDPEVVGAGWRGVNVKDGWTEFADAGPGKVEALLGYLFAVRRSGALATPIPTKARFYRNADIEWSYLLRDAGAGVLVALDLPVRQARHRGYHDSDPAYRDKESRRTYDRFLQRFRGREELRLSGDTQVPTQGRP